MFDRYTEDARQAIAIAREEAAKLGSTSIEAEHLLLGVSRSNENLKEVLGLGRIEDAIRDDLAATSKSESAEMPADLLLSNASKRILAYAAEEAIRLNSPGIGSGHLLLGVLRESGSIASHFLTDCNVDLQAVRQIVASSRREGDTERPSGSIGLASQIKRRYWIGIAVQLALLLLLGAALVKSTLSGRPLLLIAAVWFLAVLTWSRLGPSSFFLSLGKRNRAKVAVIYAFGWLFQLFMFGWLLPLIVGMYRVVRR